MPAPPPPPPPPAFNIPNPASGDDGRSLLLQSIRAGKTLKKTVTIDKSAPIVSGKIKVEASNYSTNNSSSNVVVSTVSNSSSNALTGLGGLFSSGMPKLKPTGLRGNVSDRDINVAVNNASVAHTSIAHHTMKRGPPPVPPPATQKPQVFASQVQSGTDVATTSVESAKGYGKQMLVHQKPSPPPKKLNLTSGTSVSRAQSMRLPRSPPVPAPTPQSLHQSQDCLNEMQPRPTNRVLRPPIARPPSPPIVKSNSGASTVTRVAPPPPSRITVTAPCIPPPHPPLPLRPVPPHQRLAPPPPPPPTPPTRGSSMRNGHTANSMDLEVRFGEMFHSISDFPLPEPFRGFTKVYSSRNAAKQQAPAPPLQTSSIPSAMLPISISIGGKQWSQNAASLMC